MFENITIPAGFTPVADPTALANSGARSSRLFFEGDKIVVSEGKLYSSFRTNADGSVKKDEKTGEPYLVFHIAVEVDGHEQVVPFASFRRFPRDVEPFLKESALMRSLYSGSDYDRYSLIKGRTLKVVRTVEGEAIDWTATNALRASGNATDYVFKKSKFAVFDFADSASSKT